MIKLKNKAKQIIENKKIITSLTIIALMIITITVSFHYIKNQKLPEISDLKKIEFYSIDQKKYFELNNKHTDNYVNLDKVSEHLVNAILSVEDQHFFEHHGFNYRRIIKSIIDNISSMSKKYGASTITQQYARNLYLTHEKSYLRKLKEAYYTIILESNYSKTDILEGYLNTIYFGHGIYGIGDAVKFYYNKEPLELTIAEAAVLAAIPKGPSLYSPINNFEKNNARKEIILKLMLDEKKITLAEYENALNEEIEVIGKQPKNIYQTAPYFQDIIMYELEKHGLIDDPFINGIKVYTTLDLALNEIAEQAVNNLYNPNSTIETGVYALDPLTGYVKTVIGGRNYYYSQYNRALAGQRHPGSTIKPLLYYAALEYGFTPTTTFKSEPTTFYLNNGSEKYSPSNFQNIYAHDDVTMAYALAVSDNIYAIKTHLFLGESTLINIAKRLGITAQMKPVPSLALGSTEIKLSELTNAYAQFANLGKKISPVYITKITDLNDFVLYEHKLENEQILNPDLCFILNHMLTGMFDPNMSYNQSVTGLSIHNQLSHKYAGKSGSTDYDNIMIGFNPELVVGVWTGYDKQVPLVTYEEKGYSKRVWLKIMENYFSNKKPSWYDPPKNVTPILIDPIGGKVNAKNRYAKILYYMKGTEPFYY